MYIARNTSNAPPSTVHYALRSSHKRKKKAKNDIPDVSHTVPVSITHQSICDSTANSSVYTPRASK